MRRLLLLLLALGLGVGLGEYLATSFPARKWIGQFVRRGDLQALIGRDGIYENDVERARLAELFALGTDPREIERTTAAEQKRAALERLIRDAKVRAAAAGETTDPAAVAREIQLLRDQFVDEKSWQKSLRAAGLTAHAVEREVRSDLRDRAWLEKQIAQKRQPNDAEMQRFYAEHAAAFQEPLRLRASHLFLAAPDGYPAEVIEEKRALIGQLAQRIKNGESFPALVAEFSEDEATKKRAGDLGYFAEARMLPEVFAAAERLQPGEISAPVRSRLGFHLIRLTETRSARLMTLEEARPEIITRLENQKRPAAIAALRL